MSSHTLTQNHRFLTKNVIKPYLISAKKFVQSILSAYVALRQEQANYKVAQILQATEYQKQSFEYILFMVKSGRISEIEK